MYVHCMLWIEAYSNGCCIPLAFLMQICACDLALWLYQLQSKSPDHPDNARRLPLTRHLHLASLIQSEKKERRQHVLKYYMVYYMLMPINEFYKIIPYLSIWRLICYTPRDQNNEQSFQQSRFTFSGYPSSVRVQSTVKPYISRVLYFAVFPMTVSSLEFNFADFEFVTLLQYTAKMLTWYLILWKQFAREIRKINPTWNLRLLQ